MGVVRLTGLERPPAQMITVASGFPAAANVCILASRDGDDHHLASQIVFVTTLLRPVRLPLLLALVGGSLP